MLVDGYNVIHAWRMDTDDLDASRDRLIHILDNYAGFSDEQITVVFDGYNIKGPINEEKHGRITVIFTAYGVTADTYIQRAVRTNAKNCKVVTADYLVQMSVSAAGAIRITPGELKLIIKAARSRHIALIDRTSLSGSDLKNRLIIDAFTDDLP